MPSTTPFSASTATRRGFSATHSSTAVSTVVAVMLTGMNAKTAHALCTNECIHPSDGHCDDGGPDHDYDICDLGSDCDDCGVRCDSGQIMGSVSGQCVNCGNAEEGNGNDGNDHQSSVCIPCDRPNAITFDTTIPGCVITECKPEFHIRTGGAYCDLFLEGPGCGHTCRHGDDGECDDGGPGAAYADCAYGSDCGDCGLRCAEGQIADPIFEECVTCGHKEEPNLDYDACIACERQNATQFADAPGCVITQCDPQYALHIRTGGVACDPIQEGPGCGHECIHADDGYCDDGGPGHDWTIVQCAYGSDCGDCGERETLECPNKHEFKHNETSAWCEPCQRDNALGFEDVGGNKCVITECRSGPSWQYYLSLDHSHCDGYKEGKGCNNDCYLSRNGKCDDGSDSVWGFLYHQECALGTDCADCGLQCGNAHEQRSRACVVCERPGAAHFKDVEGCVIANCSEGNSLTDARTCEGTPELCYLNRSGYELTAEGVCAKCHVPYAVSYVAGVDGCEVETCEAGFKPTPSLYDARMECIAHTPEPTLDTPVSGVRNANDQDDGFNPLWLLLLIPVMVMLGAVGAYFISNKKGHSAAASVDDALVVVGQAEEAAPLLPEPEAEADGEVQQAMHSSSPAVTSTQIHHSASAEGILQLLHESEGCPPVSEGL